DPALFLAAARALGMAPGQCFVVEDAVVGIQAAKAGGMYAIGVARHHDADLLRAADADMVVERLDTIDVQALLSDGSAGPEFAPETSATDRRTEHV
ncbi:MAG TPA: HAD-IA family hydrolase, partial [Ktedonobacterales bacterium]|nr:HAD-IA family hydrolase [Ktedonobacterales bacterium]